MKLEHLTNMLRTAFISTFPSDSLLPLFPKVLLIWHRTLYPRWRLRFYLYTSKPFYHETERIIKSLSSPHPSWLHTFRTYLSTSSWKLLVNGCATFYVCFRTDSDLLTETFIDSLQADVNIRRKVFFLRYFFLFIVPIFIVK